MDRNDRQNVRDVDVRTGPPVRSADVVDAEWREVKPALYRKLPKARPSEPMSGLTLLVALIAIVLLLGVWRAWTDPHARRYSPPAPTKLSMSGAARVADLAWLKHPRSRGLLPVTDA